MASEFRSGFAIRNNGQPDDGHVGTHCGGPVGNLYRVGPISAAVRLVRRLNGIAHRTRGAVAVIVHGWKFGSRARNPAGECALATGADSRVAGAACVLSRAARGACLTGGDRGAEFSRNGYAVELCVFGSAYRSRAGGRIPAALRGDIEARKRTQPARYTAAGGTGSAWYSLSVRSLSCLNRSRTNISIYSRSARSLTWPRSCPTGNRK